MSLDQARLFTIPTSVNHIAFESVHIKVKREKLQMEKTCCALGLSRCRGGKARSGILGIAPSLLAEAMRGESHAWGDVGLEEAAYIFCSVSILLISVFHSLSFIFGKENCC